MPDGSVIEGIGAAASARFFSEALPHASACVGAFASSALVEAAGLGFDVAFGVAAGFAFAFGVGFAFTFAFGVGFGFAFGVGFGFAFGVGFGFAFGATLATGFFEDFFFFELAMPVNRSSN